MVILANGKGFRRGTSGLNHNAMMVWNGERDIRREVGEMPLGKTQGLARLANIWSMQVDQTGQTHSIPLDGGCKGVTGDCLQRRPR